MKSSTGEFVKESAVAGLGGSAVGFASSFAIVNGVNALHPLTVSNVWLATGAAGAVTFGTGVLLREKAPVLAIGCGIAGFTSMIGSLILGLYAQGSPLKNNPISTPAPPGSSGAIMPPQVPNPIALVARALAPR